MHSGACVFPVLLCGFEWRLWCLLIVLLILFLCVVLVYISCVVALTLVLCWCFGGCCCVWLFALCAMGGFWVSVVRWVLHVALNWWVLGFCCGLDTHLVCCLLIGCCYFCITVDLVFGCCLLVSGSIAGLWFWCCFVC